MEYQQAVKAIESFIQNKDGYGLNLENPPNCLFVTGSWGIGKTAMLRGPITDFAREYYKKPSGDVVNIRYYSLAGKDSIEQIDRELFTAIDPEPGFLRSLFGKTGKSLQLELGKGPLSATLSLASSVDDKDLKRLTSRKDWPRFLLILDDLERLSPSVDFETLLGLINHIQLYCGLDSGRESKVILVCNEEKILLLPEREEKLFRGFKDKLTADSIEITTISEQAVKTVFSNGDFYSQYLGCRYRNNAENNIRILAKICKAWTVVSEEKRLTEPALRKEVFALLFAYGCEKELKNLPPLPAITETIDPETGPQDEETSRILQADSAGQPFKANPSLERLVESLSYNRELFQGAIAIACALAKTYDNGEGFSLPESHLPTEKEIIDTKILQDLRYQVNQSFLFSDEDRLKFESGFIEKIKSLTIRGKDAVTYLFELCVDLTLHYQSGDLTIDPKPLRENVLERAKGPDFDMSDIDITFLFDGIEISDSDPIGAEFKKLIEDCREQVRLGQIKNYIDTKNWTELQKSKLLHSEDDYLLLLSNCPINHDFLASTLTTEQWHGLLGYVKIFKESPFPEIRERLKETIEKAKGVDQASQRKAGLLLEFFKEK